jgi:hypothetical protein
MEVDAFRVMWNGKFQPWEHGDTDALREKFSRWFSYADNPNSEAR